MDLSRLKAINDAKAQLARDEIKAAEEKMSSIDLQETIVKVARSFVDFIEGNVSKTVVLNQIKDFATHQDAEQLVSSVNSLHETLKTHENTDLTPVTEVMNRVLEQVTKLPKDHPKQEKQKFVDYSKQLKDLARAIELTTKAIQAQKLYVEAPQVNVEAPNVQVDAPDLKPITKEIDKAFSKAIKGIPKPDKVDLTKLEKESKAQTKLLKEIRDTPGGGSGGGSGSIAPFLNAQNELPIATTSLDLQVEDTGTYTYLGNATPGTATSEAKWRIKRVTNASGVITHADGTSAFTKTWDDRAGYSY